MLTRFRTNVARYPRLFKTWLVLSILTVGYYFLPWMVGVVVVSVLASLIYLWIFSDAGRTAIFLDIISRFEGRNVCTIQEHIMRDIDDDTEELLDEVDEVVEKADEFIGEEPDERHD